MSPNRYGGRRVLIVGNIFGRDLSADFYFIMPKLLHGFVRIGCNVQVFNDRDVARGSTPLLTSSPGAKSANRKLIEACSNFRPDLLFLGHCELIRNETVIRIREENPNCSIVYRNVDPLPDPANRKRIQRRALVVDTIFLTAASPLHGVSSDSRAPVYFMPNPVDPAIDTVRSFERTDQDHDLFFAVSSNDGKDPRVRFAQAAARRVPSLRADIKGTPGNCSMRGAAFIDAIANARMALSLSRPDTVYLYASDRMSQMLGNGLLTFVARSTGFRDLFSEDEIGFFEDLDELVDKLKFFAANDKRRQAVAEAGWSAAHSMFASDRIAKYILERSFNAPLSETYPWPTATVNPVPSLQD